MRNNVKTITGSPFAFDYSVNDAKQSNVNRRIIELAKQLWERNSQLEKKVNQLLRGGPSALRAPDRTTNQRDKMDAVNGSIIHHPNNIEAYLNGIWVALNGGDTTNPTVINIGPYTLTSDDYDVFVDTSLGDVDIYLPPVFIHKYRIINCGTSGNKVNIYPDGTDLLNGFNAMEFLVDWESLVIKGDLVKGWG